MSNRNLNKDNSEATLLCDQSVNELNMLMLNDFYNGQNNLTNTSPHKGISTDKYNQMTKLDDDEENVDFMQMFNNFQQHKKASEEPSPTDHQNVQFYPQQNEHQQSERDVISYDQPRQQIEDQNYHPQHQQQARSTNIRPSSAGKPKNRIVRPSSANVEAGRFLASQNSQKNYSMHYGGGSLNGIKSQNLEQFQMQYQQPHSMGNMGPTINTYNQNKINSLSNVPSQRNAALTMFNTAKPPLMKKRIRPQSAAKNQMKPAKELQSVTNFTFQKAKQNQNQRSYVPDSLKNTDKERLYEDKINLKKNLNELTQENQILKTQLQTQNNVLKRKEDQIQNIMIQMFTGNAINANPSMDNFLDEFQRREIQHSTVGQHMQPPVSRMKANKSSLNQVSNKDNTIIVLKSKLKDVNDLLMKRDKELQDLKQTLKFTKIKEFESELALNVQESQRLRILLEREMQKQMIDPRLVIGLKQQITQYQQIIQNLQQNQQIQQENNEKLNKKLIFQIKKFAKMKEQRKKLNVKRVRLEKKVQILQAKLNNTMALQGTKMIKGQSSGNLSINMINSNEVQQMQNQYDQQIGSQTDLINKLLKRMEQRGMPISQEELMEMQMQQPTQLDHIEEEDEDMYDQKTNNFNISAVLEATKEERQIECSKDASIDQLREDISRGFDLADNKSFKIRVWRGEEKAELELTKDNFDQVFNIHTGNEVIRLEIVVEDEDEEYDEDPFEKTEKESETFMLDIVTHDQVKARFQEMKSIFQIKNIKKGDILKYILYGQRHEGKKVKHITINMLLNLIEKKVGFTAEQSMQIARFCIDDPQVGEKQIQKTKNYEKETKILRKDLHTIIQKNVEDYSVFNGLHITKMLSKIQDLLDSSQRVELQDDLEYQDEEDTEIASLDNIFKSMKMIGIMVGNFDPEIKEFIQFLAMRHSKSLDKVNYPELIKAFCEDFNYLDDKKSRWQDFKDDGEAVSPFEPSSVEDELESEIDIPESPNKSESEIKYSRTPSNLDELQQNILLEKVDEILMQIVKSLPDKHKIKTLTGCMMPNLKPVYDESQGKQFLIINQDDFIQFLLGKGRNQLGLQLNQSHVVCLLHLLVQETGDEDEKDPESITRFILFDEFIELVKTYMKKELIMQQSKGLGIHYDILSKESVEFLFQIRSSLMHENKINEDSEDDENLVTTSKLQKAVPTQIREIFNSIVQTKNIAMKSINQGQSHQNAEVMDFEEMLEILQHRMRIQYPSNKAQEELKYLFCLDFKYLEMIMLVKFDKVMHDLDYISIDLLRQAQDLQLNETRKMNLNQLRRTRDKQIVQQKKIQSQSTYESQNIYTQGNQLGPDFQGVSQSSKQEKKRKRPDDKRQLVPKKSQLINQRSKHEQDFNDGNQNVGNSMTNDLYQEDDFDNMNNHENESTQKKKQTTKISDPSEYEEEFLQDDIPIDEDEDDEDDDEDGIISDNYEQLAERRERESGFVQQKSDSNIPIEDNVISMDHSDDIQESGDIMDVRQTQEITKSEGPIEDEEEQQDDEIEDLQSEQQRKQLKLMEEVIDQMQEDVDDEDEDEDDGYDEDLEMDGLDMEQIQQLEEQVRAQMEEMDEIEDGDQIEEGVDLEDEFSDNLHVKESQNQMSDEKQINDNYEDEEYESNRLVSSGVEDENNLRKLSGTKSGILNVQQEDEDEILLESLNKYEDFEQLGQQNNNQQDNFGGFDDLYEDIEGDQVLNSKGKSSVAQSKEMVGGYLKTSSKNQFGEPVKSHRSITKPPAYAQYSIHSSQNRYAQMSNHSSVKELQQSMSNRSEIKEKVSTRSKHSQIQQQVIESRSQRSIVKSEITKSQMSVIVKSETQSQRVFVKSEIPKSQRSSVQKSIKSSHHSSVKQILSHHSAIEHELTKSNQSSRYSGFETENKAQKESVIQSQISHEQASKLSSKQQSMKMEIEQQLSEYSQHSLKDDIMVPSLHSSQRGVNKSHTSKVSSKKAKDIIPSSIKQSQNSASGLVFNPAGQLDKQSRVSSSIKNSIRESVEKPSSKASTKKPEYKAQGNFMAADDDVDEEENYSEEQYSHKDEIAQDIGAGNSEVEDFSVDVPTHQQEPEPVLFQRRQIPDEVGESQQFTKSIKSKKSVKSSIKSSVHQSQMSGAKKSNQHGVRADNSVQVIEDNYYIEDELLENTDKPVKEQQNIEFHQSMAKSSNPKDDSDDYEF